MQLTFQDQEHVQDLEADGGNSEKIDRDDLGEMVFQKGSPALRRRFTTADHVLGDATLTDVDAELEQLPMNARCTPSGALPAHAADQVSSLVRDGRPSSLSVPDFPTPK
jgi:hypothetical protein